MTNDFDLNSAATLLLTAPAGEAEQFAVELTDDLLLPEAAKRFRRSVVEASGSVPIGSRDLYGFYFPEDHGGDP